MAVGYFQEKRGNVMVLPDVSDALREVMDQGIEDNFLEPLLAAGFRCRDQADWRGAEHWFRAALALDAESADAWGALGDVLSESGEGTGAAAALARAAALEPEQPHRWAALAERLAESALAESALAESALAGSALTGSVAAESAVAYRRWLALRPDSAPAHAGLARQLLRLGQPEAALAPLREAMLLDPENAEAATALAGLLTDRGEPLSALEAVQPMVRRRPDHEGLHFEIGRAWAALGESAKAESAWRRCLALAPEDGVGAGAALAALAAESAAPPGPPAPAYVRALFDRYAERFDRDLIDRLHYQAPGLLYAAVRRVMDDGGRAEGGGDNGGGWAAPFDILDLGCGTGLAGVAFAGVAGFLAGVDLSPRMLAEARRRGLYHSLIEGDLQTVLAGETARWDLILAADVLTYLGDLRPVLAAVARVLRPGGRFAATVEKNPDQGAVSPSATRRVRHSAAHVVESVHAAGLTLRGLEEGVLRLEKRQPVIGLVLVAERPRPPCENSP